MQNNTNDGEFIEATSNLQFPNDKVPANSLHDNNQWPVIPSTEGESHLYQSVPNTPGHDYLMSSKQRAVPQRSSLQRPFPSLNQLRSDLSIESREISLDKYKEYVAFRISYYYKEASKMQMAHNVFQLTILIGAAIVSITISLSQIPKWLPAIVSGIVTIATAVSNYYKFGERGNDLLKSAEDMQQEYNLFRSGRGSYKKLDEQKSFELFQDRMDLIRHEQFQRSSKRDNQEEKKK